MITQKDLVFSSTKDCDSNSERLDDLMKDSLGDDSVNLERLIFSSTKDFFTSERLDDLMKDLTWRGLHKLRKTSFFFDERLFYFNERLFLLQRKTGFLIERHFSKLKDIYFNLTILPSNWGAST